MYDFEAFRNSGVLILFFFFEKSVGSRRVKFYTKYTHIPKTKQNAGDLLEMSLLESLHWVCSVAVRYEFNVSPKVEKTTEILLSILKWLQSYICSAFYFHPLSSSVSGHRYCGLKMPLTNTFSECREMNLILI